MLVLGIDTSTKVGGIGLYDDKTGLIAEENLVLDQTHSERLMPAVEHLLQVSGVALEEIDGFAVAVGPGSFTGVRIGVTTVKTLAQVTGKSAIGVSTLEATARNLVHTTGLICPIFDARNRRVYTALFQGSRHGLKRLTEDGSCTIDQLVTGLGEILSVEVLQVDKSITDPNERLQARVSKIMDIMMQSPDEPNVHVTDSDPYQEAAQRFGKLINGHPEQTPVMEGKVTPNNKLTNPLLFTIVYFVGDAVAPYKDLVIDKFGERAFFPPPSLRMPRGGVVAELGAEALARGEVIDLFALTPNYLKPAEAEVTWQKKHGGR